jgi:Flp pilus assembly protein TadB
VNSASARRPAAGEPLPRSLVARPSPSRRSNELRRRRRHLQQLRRDLLVDAGLALILTVLVLSATAGLGVVALLEVPLGAGVLLSFLLERRARRRSRSTRRYRSPRPYTNRRPRHREGG